MTIGVLKEPSFETRVSLLPEHVTALGKKNITVIVEHDAGLQAFANDAAYTAVGAIVDSRAAVLAKADIVLSINPYEVSEWTKGVFIGQYAPLWQTDMAKQMAAQGVSVFSLDMLPRTTRAQSMDILSSQANIAGYKAVLIAAQLLPRYIPMFMTAAGSIPPAKVVVIGAGVAGLQAIATSRRLGAKVEVSDTRPAVKEEVQSLGAKFIEVEGAADASAAGGYAVEQSDDYKARQRERLSDSISKADIVISTAAIPGRKAPIIITKDMLDKMKPGAVIVDLAASTGGNTDYTENDKTVVYNMVSIIGNSNLATTMPQDASKLYGKNVLNFVELITDKTGNLHLNLEDDLVLGTLICNQGKIVHDRVLTAIGN